MSNPNGICVRDCKIIGFPDGDSIKDLPEGTLVEFILKHDSKQVIRVFTYENRKIKREKPLYITSGDNLQLVEKEMWPFLTAVTNPEERLNLTKNQQIMDFVSTKVKINDVVFIKSENTGDDYVKGVVKYIALVPELGSGFYFGVEIPEKKLIITNQPLTDKTIRLTVVVSAQSIKPAENYYSNNNSSLIDFEENHYSQDLTKKVLKRRVSKEDIEDEYTKNQKISPNMENTFEKFIEFKNLQKEPLIKIHDNQNESLNDSFSRMTIKNNYNKDNVDLESLRMVAETAKKYEERSAEIIAQKNDALMKKYQNLSRRKSKEAEEALRSFDYEENHNFKKSLDNVEVAELLAQNQKLAALKKRSEAVNSRKAKEAEEALRKSLEDVYEAELAQNQKMAALKKRSEAANLRKSKEAEETLRSFNSNDFLESINAEENKTAQDKIQLERQIKEQETKKAQEQMLMERKMKHQSQYIPKSNDSRNLNDSDDFFLNKNSAEELKKLKAYTKQMEKERKNKASKDEAATLLAERQERMNSIYSPDKIGMNADSSIVNTSDKNYVSKFSTTSIDVHHHPPGIPKSTGAIKKNYSNQHGSQKSNKIDEYEYYRQKHLNEEAYKNNNKISKNEETEDGAQCLPDHLKHLFLKNPSIWVCQTCTVENPISEIKCVACDTDIVCEIPDNFKNQQSFNISTYESYLDKYEVPMIKEEAEISSEFIDDDHDVVPNGDTLDCSVCRKTLLPGVGVVLRDCIHSFCKECLIDHITHNLNFEIKCPFNQDYTCDSNLQDREIKGVVGQEIYDEYLAKGAYEIQRDVNIFQCRKENCSGYGFLDGTVMICPICKSRNCTICNAIHHGMKCDEFLQKIDKTFKKVEKKEKREEKATEILNIRPRQFTVPAEEEFYCFVCEKMVSNKMGIFMEKCTHSICFNCFKNCLLRANKKDVKCPIPDCNGLIEDFLKQQMLTGEQFGHYLNRVKYNYDCRAENCDGWFTLPPNIPKIYNQKCPKCKILNCVSCKAVHAGMGCKEYQKKNVSFLRSLIN